MKSLAMSSNGAIDDTLSLLASEECIVTLAKVLDNILTEKSYSKKTRKLKLNNPTFSRRVANHKGGVDFLLHCRFSQQGQILHLRRENENKQFLWNARRSLHLYARSKKISLPKLPPTPTMNQIQLCHGRSPEENSLYGLSTVATNSVLTRDEELEVEILQELNDDDLAPVPAATTPPRSSATKPLVTPNSKINGVHSDGLHPKPKTNGIHSLKLRPPSVHKSEQSKVNISEPPLVTPQIRTEAQNNPTKENETEITPINPPLPSTSKPASKVKEENLEKKINNGQKTTALGANSQTQDIKQVQPTPLKCKPSVSLAKEPIKVNNTKDDASKEGTKTSATPTPLANSSSPVTTRVKTEAQPRTGTKASGSVADMIKAVPMSLRASQKERKNAVMGRNGKKPEIKKAVNDNNPLQLVNPPNSVPKKMEPKTAPKNPVRPNGTKSDSHSPKSVEAPNKNNLPNHQGITSSTEKPKSLIPQNGRENQKDHSKLTLTNSPIQRPLTPQKIKSSLKPAFSPPSKLKGKKSPPAKSSNSTIRTTVPKLNVLPLEKIDPKDSKTTPRQLEQESGAEQMGKPETKGPEPSISLEKLPRTTERMINGSMEKSARQKTANVCPSKKVNTGTSKQAPINSMKEKSDGMLRTTDPKKIEKVANKAADQKALISKPLKPVIEQTKTSHQGPKKQQVTPRKEKENLSIQAQKQLDTSQQNMKSDTKGASQTITSLSSSLAIPSLQEPSSATSAAAASTTLNTIPKRQAEEKTNSVAMQPPVPKRSSTDNVKPDNTASSDGAENDINDSFLLKVNLKPNAVPQNSHFQSRSAASGLGDSAKKEEDCNGHSQQGLTSLSQDVMLKHITSLSSRSDAIEGDYGLDSTAEVDSFASMLEDDLMREVEEALSDDCPPQRLAEGLEQEVQEVFGLSSSSIVLAGSPQQVLTPVKRESLDDEERLSPGILVKVKPPPMGSTLVDIQEFFNDEDVKKQQTSDTDDEMPHRSMHPSSNENHDDLEKEMAKLLAEGSEGMSGDLPPSMPWRIHKTGVAELDEADGQISERSRSPMYPLPGESADHAEDNRPVSPTGSLTSSVATPPKEDLAYSSLHAHSDWRKLHELMKVNSLHREYEMCWGSLCTLSVVCSGLPAKELGLKVESDRSRVKFNSQRSWLPLELIQGLWNLVLSGESALDMARVDYVCSKLYDVLLGSEYLEVHTRTDAEQHLPHKIWVRVTKEKMVLLGFALPVSIDKQSEWMGKLAKAIADDTQFWYGRYALPTIALAAGDNKSKMKHLIRDNDFVQSRLDVIGVITGTRRHIADCKAYIKAKQDASKETPLEGDDTTKSKSGFAEQIGYTVALDGIQQVATCLYRSGQILARSNGSASKKLELATALHMIGVAAGQWGDFEFEMQLYEKTVKILRDFGGYNTECAGDTLLSMGACNLGQGGFKAAMNCYEEALDIYRTNLGRKHDKVAKALDHIGVIHCERGNLDLAMESFKGSLKIRQDNGMSDDYDDSMADTLCWIARIYREKGLPEKAKKYFDTARDVKEEIHGADSLEVAEVLYNLAVLFDDEQDFERSLRYYRKSLKIRRAALGDEHEDVCDLITCIGNVYKSMGDNNTAIKAFRRALELRASFAKSVNLGKEQTKALIHSYEDVLDMLRRQIRASDDPNIEQDEIAMLLLKLGHLYDTVESFTKSVRCFEKALKFRLTSGDSMRAGQVLNVMGISYAKRRKFSDAMASFEQALILRRSALGEIHPDVAETLHNMGNCAAKSGDLNEARGYYDESLRVKRKTLGPNSTSIAQTLHNIGNVLAGQGSNDAALKHYEEALAMRRKNLGPDHLEVAYSLHCIAKIKRAHHNPEQAREHFSSALRIKRLKLERNHPSIAETLEQLGSLYMELGEEDEAALCLNGALNIYKSNNGEGIKVAEVYEALGQKFERRGNKAKALAYLNKSLKVRMRVLGESDVSVAGLYYNVGKLQRDQDSFHEALASFQAATKIRKKSIGRNDLMIADILCDAGKLQLKLEQVGVADKCFTEALRIRRHILDSRHEKIGECLLLSGDVFRATGDMPSAISAFTEAMDIFLMNGGEHSLLCADSCERLGLVHTALGDLAKAQEYLEKCLMTRTSVLGQDHLDVATVNHQLGIVFFDRGEFQHAEELFRDSVEVMVKSLGEDHLLVANAVLSLGRTCTKLNSPDEATMYFEQARLTKQQHLGDDDLAVEEISLEIGRAHVVKEEYEESLECFNSYLKARRAAVGDDEVVSDILHDIGHSEYMMGRLDESLKSFASALALFRVLLGDEHPNVAKTLYSLGLVYNDKGEFKESMKYHKEAFRLYRRLNGPDDLAVADSLDKISTLYMKQPNIEKALQSMKEALRIRTHNLGKDHLEVAASLFGMGVIFAESDALDKAMECYTAALQVRSEQLGEASIEVAQTLHNMGTVFGKQHDVDSALQNWQRALVAYRAAGLSDENHLVAVTIGNINMAESYLADATDGEEGNVESTSPS